MGRPGPADEPGTQRPQALWFEWCGRAMLQYNMGEHRAALASMEQSARHALPQLAVLMGVEQNFFHSLTLLAALADIGDDPERYRDSMDRVERHQVAMATWAERVPENFAHKHALVEAERARVRGDVVAARARYTDAIRAARAHG